MDQKLSLVQRFASKYHIDADKLLVILKSTAFRQSGNKPPPTNEQMAALLVVADQYNLNPFTKQIYAFNSGGGITPIVPIDGWMSIINSNENFDGMEFEDKFSNDGRIDSITCRMFRKDRSHPIEVTEYFEECNKNTDIWKKWPIRMLRHKATIQCARYAFGLSGIYDEDEAARIDEAEVAEVTAEVAEIEQEATIALPLLDKEEFETGLTNWKAIIESGKKSATDVVNMLKTSYELDEDQENTIYALEDINENTES